VRSSQKKYLQIKFVARDGRISCVAATKASAWALVTRPTATSDPLSRPILSRGHEIPSARDFGIQDSANPSHVLSRAVLKQVRSSINLPSYQTASGDTFNEPHRCMIPIQIQLPIWIYSTLPATVGLWEFGRYDLLDNSKLFAPRHSGICRARASLLEPVRSHRSWEHAVFLRNPL
jgi:hypothetical protein